MVESLIAAGLMALVATGMVSMVTTMNKAQNDQMKMTVLREIKTRFQFLLTDQNSWNQTLTRNKLAPHSNPLAICILDKTDCAPIKDTVYDLTIYEAGGGTFFNPPAHTLLSPSWPVGGSNGFSNKGEKCSTFNGNTGAGVESCPISYRVVWQAICPSSGTCFNPLVRVTVRMLYNGGSANSTMLVSQGNNATNVAGWSDDETANNTGKYDVVMKRSATTVNKGFTYAIQSPAYTGGGPQPSTYPAGAGGACATTYQRRGDPGFAGPGWTQINDHYELISIQPNGVIRFRKSGTYSCKITAVSFATDSFSFRLYKVTAPAAEVAGSIANGNAPLASYTQSTAVSNPIVTTTVDNTDFLLEQKCLSDPGGAATQYMMGLPASPYSTESTFATITCTQTN